MKLINVGLEAIGFQSPEMANKMVALIDKILEERAGKTADASKAAKDLIKLVKDSTGLNVNIIFDTEYPPSTLPFHINPDSVLGYTEIKDFYLEDVERTMERLKKVKQTSSIDLKNAKVTGIFSEPSVPIFMGYYTIMGMKLNSREIAAIIAHEIGHCFVAMELAFRTARTNQILSTIAKSSAGGDRGEYKYVLKTTEDVLGLKTGVLDEAFETKDASTALVVTLGHIEKQNQKDSVMGNTAYDVTTFEALSDNFAARLGLGKDLVTGLEKIYKAHGAPEYSLRTRIIISILDTFSANALIAGGLAIAGKISLGPMSWISIGLTLINVYYRLAGREHNNVYDTLTTRFKRIKEQLIAYIKDNKLPAQDVKRTLESINHIEKMMAEVNEYKGFLPVIFDMIDPASRSTLKARDIQGKLETLAANSLYLKAASIRTLEG